MWWEKLAYIKKEPSFSEVKEASRENLKKLKIENFEKQVIKSLEHSNERLNNKAYKLTLEKEGWIYYLYLWQLKLKKSFPTSEIGEDRELEHYIGKIAETIVDMLNYTWKIALSWDWTARKITDNGFIFRDTLVRDEDFENNKSFTKAQNKNTIEAIFVLVMQARDIQEKDWPVMNYVCRWEIDKCKKALWEKDA